MPIGRHRRSARPGAPHYLYGRQGVSERGVSVEAHAREVLDVAWTDYRERQFELALSDDRAAGVPTEGLDVAFEELTPDWDPEGWRDYAMASLASQCQLTGDGVAVAAYRDWMSLRGFERDFL